MRVNNRPKYREAARWCLSLDKIFEDKASCRNRLRPQLHAASAYCREADTIVVHSMDRLARSLVDLRRIVGDLTRRGVIAEFVKERLRFTGEDSQLLFFCCRFSVRWQNSSEHLFSKDNVKASRLRRVRAIQRAPPNIECGKDPIAAGTSRVRREKDTACQGVWDKPGVPIYLSTLL